MSEGFVPPVAPVLHPVSTELLEGLVELNEGRSRLIRNEERQWLSVEEAQSTISFADADGDKLRIVPFIGDAASFVGRSYVVSIGASWLEGKDEITLRVTDLADEADRGEVFALLNSALDFWVCESERESRDYELDVSGRPGSSPVDLGDVDFTGPIEPYEETTDSLEPAMADSGVHMRADISDQWSWASSMARIPQISDLLIDVVDPIEHARVTVAVSDSDVQFGNKVVHDGPLAAGTSALGSVHVPLSTTVMSTVEERRGADCLITLEDAGTGRVLARLDASIDIQPRDLWLWAGDPRRGEQQARLETRLSELITILQQDSDRPDIESIRAEEQRLSALIHQARSGTGEIARTLLAAFVCPNHSEVAAVAREAADRLGAATGNSEFSAFQTIDVAEAERRVDQSISAIYEALQARKIAYSEPPPQWDYRQSGQRIRDHGVVARGGLGTCMDTTVLMAAVIEHVGLHPVLVLVPSHIFVGFWRRNPDSQGATPQWYPNTPVITDPDSIELLVEGGWLGLIETTTLTVGEAVSAGEARRKAQGRIRRELAGAPVRLIDVMAARKAGVAPLHTVNQLPDGRIEIVEYRPGAAPTVIEIESSDVAGERRVDHHPARYRTWKGSLFKLNATNSLLNLGNNARVQPLVLPASGLGVLEDKLNQDYSFSLVSGFDIPAVWQARDRNNALLMLESGEPNDERDLLGCLGDRQIFIQRLQGRKVGARTGVSAKTFAREIRSMAHGAKTAFEERGMNPLFLCLGMLRWQPKPGVFADAPLILVPVNISVTRGRDEFTLSLDASQQTTPNAALLEWLRREHGLLIPGLAEPLADRAGIDVDGVLSEVRRSVADRGLAFAVSGEARIATLDLTAFRMWQDLNLHADGFMDRPLVRHLVETPTETFEDPAIVAAGDAASDESMADELEKLDTPIPADSTQKRAVLWARQARTFVLQGPPGTGKSQTITNMVAECVTSGMKVLFVAEKGTALSVVQRRLDAIGLGPFTLNLHHEGSNAAEVRAQLKRSLTATVTPDPAAMESARRRLRNARFELMQYPQRLHEPNAAGLSAYSAQDELLVLDDGPALALPFQLVAHEAEQIKALKELFQSLQQWTSAAGVKSGHPWRLAGSGDGDPFDLEVTSAAIRGVLDGAKWTDGTTGAVRQALEAVSHPRQLTTLAAASNNVLPVGEELATVLGPEWPARAATALTAWGKAFDLGTARLHGFDADIVSMDLRSMLAALQAAAASGVFGRSKRQSAAIAPLAAVAPVGLDLQASTATEILNDLIAAQDFSSQVRSEIAAIAGLGAVGPDNPLRPEALAPVRARIDELLAATAGLRDGGAWTDQANALARAGHLAANAGPIAAYAAAWAALWTSLAVSDDDFEAWRGGRTLLQVSEAVGETWRRQVDYERLLPLQNWCVLNRKLEPLRAAGLLDTRAELLEGALPAYVAEDALARGVARTSLDERVSGSGLDLFNSIAHDERVTSYAQAQAEMRRQWATDAPAMLLQKRGGGGAGQRTGGLARELEKTTRKLGTRAILRKHVDAVLELTPLVLCSPSSVVDLIEPGVMEFDVVIFDEASQIAVPEAVGALGRARSAIIVGDSKQMPPSRKLGRASSDDDEIVDDEADEIVEDQESILSECELARVPTLSLSWHYRSQDEALIAFSNRAYYRGHLSSFPTPTLLSFETGLEFRRVHAPELEDKCLYIRQGSSFRVQLANEVTAGVNTNPFEAKEIVEFIQELVNARDELPSVGIVTFNEPQRELIESLLMKSPDPRVIEVMDETRMGRGDVLFVKALEQVQGDERDTIIFSVAFSKQANGRIPINFGPLSNSGGERRLNVAITRARRKNIIYCSFEPGELDVSGAIYQGPKDLKEFLIFARASGTISDQGDGARRIAVRDRHRDDIAAALRESGLHVMCDVGLSNFRIDLVLARPDLPERPILPVLLDGESWRQRFTVSDRDVLPVEVLEGLMGWPVVSRIWWPMWLQNRQQVIDWILADVDKAEALLDNPAAKAEPAALPRSAVEPAQEVAHQVLKPPVAPASAPPTLAPPAPPTVAPASASPAAATPEPVPAPGSDPVDVSPGAPALTTSDRSAQGRYVAATTYVVGPREILDQLSDRSAAAAVKKQVLDVIQVEGPIEVSRLMRIVGRRFNLNAVRTTRVQEMARLIPRGQLRKSRAFGDFVWPVDLDPATWTGFRSSTQDDRSLDEIAPEEIANSMRAVLAGDPSQSEDELLRGTAEIFGIVRLGGNVRSRLQAVRKTLVDSDVAPSAPTTPAAPAAKEQPPMKQRGRADDIVAMLRKAIDSGGRGVLEAAPRSISWQGHPSLGLFIEVDDGRSSGAPFDQALADALVTIGWRRPKPKENLHNVWLEFQMWPDEPPHRFEARLGAAAGLVHDGLQILRDRR